MSTCCDLRKALMPFWDGQVRSRRCAGSVTACRRHPPPDTRCSDVPLIDGPHDDVRFEPQRRRSPLSFCLGGGAVAGLLTGNLGWGVSAALAIWIAFGAVEFRSFRQRGRGHALARPRQWSSSLEITGPNAWDTRPERRSRPRPAVWSRSCAGCSEPWIPSLTAGSCCSGAASSNSPTQTASNLLGFSPRGPPAQPDGTGPRPVDHGALGRRSRRRNRRDGIAHGRIASP